jgi:hypothetical protein
LWIRRNIGELIAKIVAVPNPMLVKSRLPYLAPKLLPQFMRVPTLDALGAALDGLAWRWGQQDVQVLRHHREPVKPVTPPIATVEEHLHQELSICDSQKERAPLKSGGCESIRRHSRFSLT